MAKLTAPLLSLSAKGKFGKVIEYKNWLSFAVARKRSTLISSPNPDTLSQKFFRRYFSDVVKVWQNLDSDKKLALDLLVKYKPQSGYNFHIVQYFYEKPSACGVLRCGFSRLGGLTLGN